MGTSLPTIVIECYSNLQKIQQAFTFAMKNNFLFLGFLWVTS